MHKSEIIYAAYWSKCTINKMQNMQEKVAECEISQNGKQTMPTNHAKPMSTSDESPDKDMATEYCEPGRKEDDMFRNFVHEP